MATRVLKNPRKTTFQIEEEDWVYIKKYCLKKKTSMGKLLRSIIKDFIKDE